MRVRIGKDIKIKWAVLTDGSALPLNKEELTLELAGPNGKSQSMEFEMEGNVLTAMFYGKDQNYTGDYMLTLWKNKGKEGQSVVDKTSAFSLVRYTPQEDLAQKHDNLSATLADLGDTSLVTIDGASETTLVCNLTGYKAVEDVSDLPMEPSTIGYLVGDNLYVYVGEGGDVRLGAYKNCGPFRGLKGDTGAQGPQGNSGYQGAAGELQVVNNLTEGGETAALSAEQGKVLDGKKQDKLQTYHESGDCTETSIGVHNVILAQASCSGNTRSSLLLVDKDETREPEERVARLAVEKDGEGAFSSYVGAYGDKVQIGAPNVIINATGGRKAATFEATVNAGDNTSCVALSLSHTPDGQTDPVIGSKVKISDESISMETVYDQNSAFITMDPTTSELDAYVGNEDNNSCIDIDGGTMVLNATDSLQIGAGPSGGDNTGVHIEKGIVRVQTADGVTEIVANDEEGILLSGKKISMTSGEKTVKDVVRTILGHTDDIQKLQDDTEDLQSKKQDKFATIKEIGGVTTIQTYHIDTNGNGHDELIEIGSEDNCVHIKSYSEDSDSTSSIKVSADTGVTVLSPNGEIEDIVKAIQDNTNAVDILNGDGEGSVSKTVTDKIAEVVANAPADFDTLKEIADYIASDKTNAADINNTLTALKTRVYELGDFATAKNAEDKAREPLYSGNEGISIIHYTVNGSTEGLILQHQDADNGYHRSVQTLFYHAHQYVRFVWFTDSTRTVLLENANFNRDWWETSISHLEYDKTTHTIKCRRIGQDVNSTKWITLPSASTSTDGLMTMAQVKSLEGKQDQLANYVEIPRGKTTIKYPNGTASVEVSNVRAALWANDDKVAIAADANGTRMLYQKTAEDGSIEHRDEISIGKHDENSATHITLTSKSTTKDTGEKITNTSTIQVNPDGISMTSPNGEIGDIVKEISEKASSESVSELRQEVEDKAPKVGYAPDLKVSYAEELVGRGEATPEVIGSIRPTGEISIGDGNATIAKIKGESVVWNQLIKSMNRKDDYEGTTTYYDADTNEFVLKNLSRTSNYNTGSTRGILNLVQKTLPNHKYCLYGNNNYKGLVICTANVSPFYVYNLNGIFQVSAQYTWAFRITKDFNFATYCPVGSEIRFKIYLYDLTLMFGAGNEPTTIEEFEARKPLNVSNEYNEGTIISYDGDALKSVGFNAFDGTYAKVIGGETYHATGTTSISFAKELDGDTTAITLDSENKFIPEEDGYVYAEGKDIVIHLTHSYTPEHVDEYEEDVHLLPDVTSILDAEGNQLFPYGLLSAGSVHDEITATKAIKRVGVADIGTLDWGNFKHGFTTYSIRPASGSGKGKNLICAKYPTYTPEEIYNNDAIVGIAGPQSGYWGGLFLADSKYSTGAELKAAMSGVLLYYELAEPIEVDLPEPLNMTYEAWDFGTEELLAEGATTPLNADIVYQFNAVDRIRENSSAIDGLEEHVEEHKDDGIELLANGNLKLTLKGETREFMPATPSGDPMHYAYESAGAVYNATDEIIVVDAPWKDIVDTIEDKATWGLDKVDASKVKQMTIKGVVYNYATENRTSPEGGTYDRYFLVGQSNGVWVEDETKVLHLPKCWYLNGLGDITNAEMRSIYAVKHMSYAPGGGFAGTPCRTFIDKIKYIGSDLTYGDRYYRCKKVESIYSGVKRVVNGGFNYAITSTTALRYFLPAVTLISYKNKIYGTFADASLRVLCIAGVQTTIQFPSKYISKASILYTINNVAPTLTSAITITLHADAYARLAEDADIVAALEAKPLVTLVSA